MPNLMTKANINEFLVEYIGINTDDLMVMPYYVKVDLIEGMHEEFTDYFTEAEGYND